jgi:hypothetical protein
VDGSGLTVGGSVGRGCALGYRVNDVCLYEIHGTLVKLILFEEY